MTFPFDSFKIGASSLSPQLVMAPLHEITDQPFRRFIREIGGPSLVVSEMISSEALIRKARKAERMMAGSEDRPLSVQIAGSSPEVLESAAQICQASGANFVDLNMGCPASNVTSGGAGSALLKDIKLAEQCLKAMIRSVSVPVTVKMRAGWDQSQKDRSEFIDFLKMFDAVGVQAVAIHPRTKAQQYDGSADWSIIRTAVESQPSFPIIGNGDVLTPEDAYRMHQQTGCHAVMIGRGALYNPFIFQQILDPTLVVTSEMKIEAMTRFLQILMELLEPREALHKIKKIGSWFTKGLPGGVKFRQKLNQCHDANELIHDIEELKHTPSLQS